MLTFKISSATSPFKVKFNVRFIFTKEYLFLRSWLDVTGCERVKSILEFHCVVEGY